VRAQVCGDEAPLEDGLSMRSEDLIKKVGRLDQTTKQSSSRRHTGSASPSLRSALWRMLCVRP
jgi:hypothetical protein